MLITSNYILNCTNQEFEYTIQPYIHNFCNIYSEDDPFKEFKFPDTNPSSLTDAVEDPDFSMVAGEFVEIYSN